MAKFALADLPNAYLNEIKSVADAGNLGLRVCSTQPTTYTEAVTTYKLAATALAAGDVTGPAAGDISGRKLTIAQKATITIDASGNAAHIALVDTSAQELLFVTRCPVQALTAGGGNTTTVPSWKIEVLDPV